MTTQAPTPWTELLSRSFRNVSDEYGPHSQAVARAFAVLDKVEWLQHVGELVNADTIVVVRSWDDALTIFGKDRRYDANGILEAHASASMRCSSASPNGNPGGRRRAKT